MAAYINYERRWDENGPGLDASTVDFNQCVHEVKYRAGLTKRGFQKWVCALCHEYFQDGSSRPKPIDEIAMTATHYKAGRTVEETMALSGLHFDAVYNLFLGYRRRWPEYAVMDLSPRPGVRGQLKNRHWKFPSRYIPVRERLGGRRKKRARVVGDRSWKYRYVDDEKLAA